MANDTNGVIDPRAAPMPSANREVFEVKFRWVRENASSPWVRDAAYMTGGALLQGIYLTEVVLAEIMAQEFAKIDAERGEREKRVEIVRASGISLPNVSGKRH